MSETVVQAPPVETQAIPPEDDPIVTQQQAVSIDIMDRAARLTLSDGRTKMVSHTQLARALKSFLDREEAVSGMKMKLPPNVYAMDISSTHIVLGMYYPECIRDVNFHNSVKPRVTPNVILTVTLKKETGNDWKVAESLYFCTSLPLAEFPREIVKAPDRSKKITILPFSNVYDTGRVCVGQNGLIYNYKNGDLRALNWHFEFLWKTPFNYDLGVKALRTSNFNVDSWFAHLAKLAEEKKPFPYSEIGI